MMSGRQRNPRRVVSAAMRPLTSNVRHMMLVWAGSTAPHFKPEADPERWVELATYMDAVKADAARIAAFARTQAERA